MTSSNPLIPVGYDIVWTALAIAVVVLAVVALVSLARSAKRLSAPQALIWVLIVLLVPVLGPIAWLAVGRRSTWPARR
ncbi:PLDc N-terminal domain-containing protein [Microbacterium esteraromaticum]|uniref:PLDc N-terminal domain-containing protein n=1 Tax=Microbacterium esteraromaticum TaxID=57043 RepID=UPI001C95154C|nr:PLDc N-terminal domain-containing protein [Microbacterium esteraromaticum]MBY6061943.1 PLDc N-terminal domain-containing protein [Microbacterium esteraromaticum]